MGIEIPKDMLDHAIKVDRAMQEAKEMQLKAILEAANPGSTDLFNKKFSLPFESPFILPDIPPALKRFAERHPLIVFPFQMIGVLMGGWIVLRTLWGALMGFAMGIGECFQWILDTGRGIFTSGG